MPFFHEHNRRKFLELKERGERIRQMIRNELNPNRISMKKGKLELAPMYVEKWATTKEGRRKYLKWYNSLEKVKKRKREYDHSERGILMRKVREGAYKEAKKRV